MIKCIYHHPCLDGFASLLIVKINCGFNNVDGIPANYKITSIQSILEKVTISDDVLIVDFSFSREELLLLKGQVRSLIVLDHHLTSERGLKGLHFCVFDQNKSGCTLTWEYFHQDEPVPILLRYIEDNDLWRHKMPHTSELIASLRTYPMDECLWWEQFLLGGEESVARLISEGESIVRYQQRIVDRFLSMDDSGMLQIEQIAGYPVPIINSNHLASEIGSSLAKRYPFVVIYFDDKNLRNFDLRSSKENSRSVDVSIVAEKFGGGGHKHAAGFRIEKDFKKLNELGLLFLN
jgi:oligoribonuclease NrnB/cAMP/cGMP phosphodiesterase (DHH superfamily)